MTGKQTPYRHGFRAGLIGQDYLKGDGEYKSRDYLDWWRGWQDGKAARPKATTERAARPQPRRRRPKQPQPVRRRQYLREVRRLGKVPF